MPLDKIWVGGGVSNIYLRGCNSLNIYQKCFKKTPQVPEIHIFQKIKSYLGQLGPWAHKLAQNMYKDSAKNATILPVNS